MRFRAPHRRGSSALYIVDQLLVPRIKEYGYNNDLTDVDEVISYLTRSYPEYKRKQRGTLQKLVHKAIQVVIQDVGGTSFAEGRLRNQEERHLSARQGRELAEVSERDSVDEDSPSGQKKRRVQEELEEYMAIPGIDEVARAPSLNDSLRVTYEQKRPSLPLPVTTPPLPQMDVVSPLPGAKRRSEGGGQHRPKRQKKESGAEESASALAVPRPVRFCDFGGLGPILDRIRLDIIAPMENPAVFRHFGVSPPGGVLFHGPPGCGKTMLAHAIAGEVGVPFLKVSAPELVSGMSGESEAKVRSLFAEAERVAPCIVFIDEIDAIAPKRETAQREMERRIVAQMLTCMDDLNQPGEGNRRVCGHVAVIGATNRPDALDPALRRAGRFDREIALGIPDEAGRAAILRVHSARMRVAGELDLRRIARATPGFVGADLEALCKEAGAIAVQETLDSRPYPIPVEAETGGEGAEEVGGVGGLHLRVWSDEELEGRSVGQAHFEAAVGRVQPSAMREGFSTIPDVSWEDVGAMAEVRAELQFNISRQIRHPEEYAAMGISLCVGTLLYGPPGCGKTLVAKAVASEGGANFISIKGPELLNKYVGESERAVRQLFSRARASAPCVLFFDEMDAMAPRRGSDGNAAAERVVNQLLTEMDGMDRRGAVFIVAATNRPDIMDPALLRPGRLDKLLYVPLPTAPDRQAILRTLTRNCPLAEGVDVGRIAGSASCEGFSGADLAALVREACMAALRERQEGEGGEEKAPPTVSEAHFDSALLRVQPSVSQEEVKRHEAIQRNVRGTRRDIVVS